MYKYGSRTEFGFLSSFPWKGVLLIVFFGFCVWALWGETYYQEQTATVTICSKERAANRGGGEYRVYTASSGTFVIKDTHWPGHWRTNSADVYGQLHVPGTFQITYVGFRSGLMSWFHNITSYKKIEPNKPQLAMCDS